MMNRYENWLKFKVSSEGWLDKMMNNWWMKFNGAYGNWFRRVDFEMMYF